MKITEIRPPKARRWAGPLGLAGLILLALNLRGPLVSIAPVITSIRADLGIDSTAAGLLTTIPVLCFGVLTPFASYFIARTSIDTAVLVTLFGVAAGSLLRPTGGFGLMIAGTVVIGAAITVGNIVALMVIVRDYPRRVQSMTGFYTACLNVSTMLTLGLTAPMTLLVGWRVAIAAWAALAVLGLAIWPLAQRAREATAQSSDCHALAEAFAEPAPPLPPVWRRPLVWLLALAFASHLVLYYGLTAWMPLLLIDTAGMSPTAAGGAASVFQILGLLGSFGMPVLLRRFSSATMIVSAGVFWAVTALGFLWAPAAWLLWSITGGYASGGGFIAIFVLAMAHARGLDDNRRVLAAVQGVAYVIAAPGPTLIGAIHQTFGGWSASLILLAALATPAIAAGALVARVVRPSD